MSLHSDGLFWFRANQSLLWLIKNVCLAEKYKKTTIVFDFTGPGLESMTNQTRGEHANHYTNDDRSKLN